MDNLTLLEKDRKLIHPLQNCHTHQEPIIIERGEGSWLLTCNGMKILDAFAGMWNVNIGYGNTEVAETASNQMKTMAYMSSFSGASNTPAIVLADKLAGYAYPDLNATFFTSGGSEANDSAFKTMYYYWKRVGKPNKTKIISTLNSFHGFTIASTAATGIEKFSHMFGPSILDVHYVPFPYTYRYAEDMRAGETVGESAARLLEETILQEDPDTIGGFIIEPIQGVGGGIIPPDDYFPKVRQICDKYDILLISDEVITGFGRTGKMFGLNHWGIQPDILSFAKGVTSGYLPLGGIQINDAIHETIKNAEIAEAWLHGYTYSAHPTTCAVAMKNIEILERENLLDNVNTMSAKLFDELQGLDELSCVGEIRHMGLLSAVELVKDKESGDPDIALATNVYLNCLSNGVRLRALNNNIAIAPPFIITEDEVHKIVDTLGDAISTLMLKQQ